MRTSTVEPGLSRDELAVVQGTIDSNNAFSTWSTSSVHDPAPKGFRQALISRLQTHYRERRPDLATSMADSIIRKRVRSYINHQNVSGS
jgi:hypothetical protein